MRHVDLVLDDGGSPPDRRLVGILGRSGRVGLLLMTFVIASCQGAGAVSSSAMTISAMNATTKNLVLVVNGSLVKELQPGAEVDVPASALPALPWTAEVRLPIGRSLVTLTVHPGDVVLTPSGEKGDAARVDLSCGRIDLWSGPPLVGPALGPGIPGDCDP